MIGLLSGIGLVALTALVVWDMVWKMIAGWHAARNKQLIWFICIFIFNTLGILPIVYLLWFRKDK
jgi:methionyl-tRNA synthetase